MVTYVNISYITYDCDSPVYNDYPTKIFYCYVRLICSLQLYYEYKTKYFTKVKKLRENSKIFHPNALERRLLN